MADFLTVNGVPVPIQRDKAQRGTPERIGDSGRAANGDWLSTVRGSKRTWTMTTGYMYPADFETLEAMVKDEQEVVCNGDSMGNVDTPCIIDVTNADMPSDGTVDGFLYIATLAIKEA